MPVKSMKDRRGKTWGRVSRGVIALLLLTGGPTCWQRQPKMETSSLRSARFPARYAGRLRTTLETSAGERQVSEMRIARSGAAWRQEVEPDGARQILIFQPQARAYWLLLPERRIYFESSAEARAEAESQRSAPVANPNGLEIVSADEELGEEPRAARLIEQRSSSSERLLEGHPCRLDQQREQLVDGAVRVVSTWLAEDLGRLVLRSEIATERRGERSLVRTELLEVTTQVDEDLFQIPAGYTKRPGWMTR